VYACFLSFPCHLQAELARLFARAKSAFGLTTSIDVALPDAR
jgi:hypothetical protein